ncbi:MAG: hypothetical protein OS112_01555 [Methanoregula sp.]|nr:MAG: hypothetical protein OS112_01555 [Methanoregula sp.]
MAAAELTAAHTGTPAHDPGNDSFSTTVRCHDPNGELYNVTFSRDRVTVTSYSDSEDLAVFSCSGSFDPTQFEARWLLLSHF